MGAGRRVGGAKLKVELGGRGKIAHVRNRADTDSSFPVAKAKIVERSAPAVRSKSEVRNDTRRRDGDDRIKIFEHAGDKLTRNFSELILALWVPGRRLVALKEAEVDMNPVAHAGRVANRRERR